MRPAIAIFRFDAFVFLDGVVRTTVVINDVRMFNQYNLSVAAAALVRAEQAQGATGDYPVHRLALNLAREKTSINALAIRENNPVIYFGLLLLAEAASSGEQTIQRHGIDVRLDFDLRQFDNVVWRRDFAWYMPGQILAEIRVTGVDKRASDTALPLFSSGR